MVTRHGSEPFTEVEPGVIFLRRTVVRLVAAFVSDPGASIASRSQQLRAGTGRSSCMTHPKPTPPTEASEIERLNPGSNRERLPQPQPPRPVGQRNKAALPGSQNADLQGPKPKRGPRGAST